MTTTRRALLSVSDKTGLVPFARALLEAGYELVSTGGTFKTLREAGLAVRYVTEITGQPEVFGGRVKTLHPVVHGGILFRRDLAEHVEQAAAAGIAPIDIVAVNLYPFTQTIAKPGVTLADAVEQIDIGGPAMVRASAKNFASVTIVTSPGDYDRVAATLPAGGPSLELRRELAIAAYRHTATYDAAIAEYLAGEAAPEPLPAWKGLILERDEQLRYGENPHQGAALYHAAGEPRLGGARVLQGKALSFNNLVDVDAAVGLVLEYGDPTAVIIKHTNPCGVGRNSADIALAYRAALAADPVSAFGGIVAVNRPIDGALAQEMSGLFLEVIAAPAFSAEAVEVLGRKTALRLLEFDATRRAPHVTFRQTLFGTLAQTSDPLISDCAEEWNVVTDLAPTDEQRAALAFLWRVCKHVKSNAIVIGGADSTYGVGAGQMSRVESVRIAVSKSVVPLAGSCLASDAFFPFRDGLDLAADAGVTAIIQPGGSKRDDEVIAAANERGIAMVFTASRHFRH